MSQAFSQEAFVELLERVVQAVREGDSFEGSIVYRMPVDSEPTDAYVMVDAAIRTGNWTGQGSVTLIGSH